MLAEFEKRIALALIALLQAEDILVKCDRFPDVADFDGDVIAAIHLHAHLLGGLLADAAICLERATISVLPERPSMKRCGIADNPACAPTSAPVKRNPWRAGTVEWLAEMRGELWGVRSIPEIDCRYPLWEGRGPRLDAAALQRLWPSIGLTSRGSALVAAPKQSR